MRTLLSERFAPVTSSIGFLQAPLDEVAKAVEEWRRSLYDHVSIDRLDGSMADMFRRLEPLTGGARPRELMVGAKSGWSAYFDNSLRGTDAVSAVGYLSTAMACQGLAITAVPHTVGRPNVRAGRLGAVQFELFGPLRTEFANYVRTVSTTHDGSRWRFLATGTEQAFEDPSAYARRRIRDRFTSDMLEQYCRALDVDPFNQHFYGPDAVFVESSVPMAQSGASMSLAEAQRWLEIEPGTADLIPG